MRRILTTLTFLAAAAPALADQLPPGMLDDQPLPPRPHGRMVEAPPPAYYEGAPGYRRDCTQKKTELGHNRYVPPGRQRDWCNAVKNGIAPIPPAQPYAAAPAPRPVHPMAGREVDIPPTPMYGPGGDPLRQLAPALLGAAVGAAIAGNQRRAPAPVYVAPPPAPRPYPHHHHGGGYGYGRPYGGGYGYYR